MEQVISVHLFYPLLFILIILAGFGIYHIVLTIIANHNSQDTTTKMQFMFEKSTDTQNKMFDKATDTQKELQIDSTDKIYRLADNMIKLDYTRAEALETHDINKKLKELEARIRKIENQ